MDEINDVFSIITVKNNLSNRFGGTFRIFREEETAFESSILVFQKDRKDVNSLLSVWGESEKSINSVIRAVYADISDMDSIIDSISINELQSTINVPPHNRFKSSFNLMAAPVKTVTLSAVADATTRSREDLKTINYGDTNSMLIGRTTEEEFNSFVSFGDLKDRIPDIKLVKGAKLRLYYSSLSTNGANVRLSQPSTLWREMGVTDTNKPSKEETLKNDGYTINTVSRYIEFDFLDVVEKWNNKEIENYGFIISSDDDNRYSFFTRESGKSSELIITYVTSQIYSIGRSEFGSSINIIGAGRKELSSRINVHSDVDTKYLESSIYIHRYEDPVPNDASSSIKVGKPDLASSIFVKIGNETKLDGLITVIVESHTDLNGMLTISKPDLCSRITLDNNVAINSLLTVRKEDIKSLDATVSISKPDLFSHLTVSEYTSGRSNIDALIRYKNENESTISSTITISKPDLSGTINIHAVGNSDLGSMIQAREINEISSLITISKPDISGELTVAYYDDLDGVIFVRDSVYMDGIIDVVHSSDLSGFISSKQASDVSGIITISRPDLYSTLSVKVTRDIDLESKMMVRQRDVADLGSYIRIGGKGNRNIIIMF